MFDLMETSQIQSNIKKTFKKQNVNEDSIKYFKIHFKQCQLEFKHQQPDSCYNMFLNKFKKISDIAFPETKIEIKQKNFVKSLYYTRREKTFKEKTIYMKVY